MCNENMRVDEIENYRALSKKAIDQGQYDVAVSHYEKALDCLTHSLTSQPSQDPVSSQSAEAASLQASYFQAEREATQVALYSNLALCYLKLEKYSSAEENASLALAIQPHHEKCLYRRAMARVGGKQNFLGAAEDCNLLIKLQGANVDPATKKLFMQIRSHALTQDYTQDVTNAIAQLKKTGNTHQQMQQHLQTCIEWVMKTLKVERLRQWEVHSVCTNILESTLQELTHKHDDTAETATVKAETANTETETANTKTETATVETETANVGRETAAMLTTVMALRLLHLTLSEVAETREKIVSVWDDLEQISGETESCRQTVAKSLQVDLLLSALKQDIGKGVSVVRTQALRKAEWKQHGSEPELRGWLCCELLDLTRMMGDLENRQWLSILAEGLRCSECKYLQEKSLDTFAFLCNKRKLMGVKVRAIKQTHELNLCLQALCQLIELYHVANDTHKSVHSNQPPDTNSPSHTNKNKSSHADDLSRKIEFALLSIFHLLSDKERAADDEIDWKTLTSSLIEERLAEKNDQAVQYTAFVVLNVLWLANREQVNVVANTTAAAILALALSVETQFGDIRLQRAAAEFLVNVLEFVEVRAILMQNDAVDLLCKMAETSSCRQDVELHAMILTMLARFSVHDESTRALIFDQIDFVQVVEEMINNLNLPSIVGKIGGEKSEERSTLVCEGNKNVLWNETEDYQNKRRKKCLLLSLQVINFLNVHKHFKSSLLKLPPNVLEKIEKEAQAENLEHQERLKESDSNAVLQNASLLPDDLVAKYSKMLQAECESQKSVILRHLGLLGRSMLRYKCSEGYFLFVSIVHNFIRSSADKERLKKTRGVGPDFDEEQLRQLELLYEKLPEHARPQEKSKYDRGSQILAQAIKDFMLSECEDVLVVLKEISVSRDPPPTTHLLKLESQCVRLFAKDTKMRSKLFRQGGLAILKKTVEGCAEDEDELRDLRQCIAHLVMAIPPNALRYDEVMSCTSQLMPLLSDSHELFTYEGALALTNLSAAHDDVRWKLWGAWRTIEDVACSDNDMVRAAGLELMCNCLSSEKVCDDLCEKIKNRKIPWNPTLLLAFATEVDNVRSWRAALGVLAFSSQYLMVAMTFISAGTDRLLSVANAIEHAIGINDEDIQLRCICFVANIWNALQAVSDEDAKSEDLKSAEIQFTAEERDLAKELSLKLGLLLPIMDDKLCASAQDVVSNLSLSISNPSRETLLTFHAENVATFWASKV